ncbi:MAG TPA: hypothetical protein VD908_20240 [Cytophagales bacterium]|nr:hypothetical protein [Cytophagales bacterium]
MIIDVIALFLLAGLVYMGFFSLTEGPDDPSREVTHEEKIYDSKSGLNKFNI